MKAWEVGFGAAVVAGIGSDRRIVVDSHMVETVEGSPDLVAHTILEEGHQMALAEIHQGVHLDQNHLEEDRIEGGIDRMEDRQEGLAVAADLDLEDLVVFVVGGLEIEV